MQQNKKGKIQYNVVIIRAFELSSFSLRSLYAYYIRAANLIQDMVTV